MRPLLSHIVSLAGATVVGCALGIGYSGGRSIPEITLQARAAEHVSPQELDQLLTLRYQTAKALLDMEEKRLHEGVTTIGRVCEVARWVRDSAVELPAAAQARMAALTNYVALTRRLEASVESATKHGAAPPADRESARYLRLDAEIMLLRTTSRGP